MLLDHTNLSVKYLVTRYYPVGIVIAWLIAVSSLPSLGQVKTGTMTGIVTDKKTGDPLVSASIYINGTTIGTVTNERGQFQLSKLPLGPTDVVISYVGYLTKRQVINLLDDQSVRLNVSLLASDRQLDEIVVKAKNDKQWHRQLKHFSQVLIGPSRYSGVTIENPYVLRFSQNGDHLSASASAPLRINNPALGYTLIYELEKFDTEGARFAFRGTARFEPVVVPNATVAKQIERNRMQAYAGSLRQALVSLLTTNGKKQGFSFYQEDPAVPVQSSPPTLLLETGRHLLPADRRQLVTPGPSPNEYQLMLTKPIVIFYRLQPSSRSPYVDAPYAYSQLMVAAQPLIFRANGTLVDADGLVVSGSLSDYRLSRLLPSDWSPEVTPKNSVGSDQDTSPRSLPLTVAFGGKRVDTLRRQQVLLGADKTYCLAGDTLSIRVELINVSTHELDTTDAPVYLDYLDNAQGRLLKRSILQLTHGQARVVTSWPDSLRTGTYQLRAYTNWMRNFPVQAFGQLQLTVVGLDWPQRQKLAPTPAGSSVQAVPEGRQLVAQLPATITVRVQDTWGDGVATDGVVQSDKTDSLISFKTDSSGLATVTFVPQIGTRYWVLATGRSANLPSVNTHGAIMHCDELTDPDRVRLSIRQHALPPGDTLLFVAHARGHVTALVRIPVSQHASVIYLPKENLLAGLTNLVLLTSRHELLAERMVFMPDTVSAGTQLRAVKVELDEPITAQSPQQLSQSLLLRTNIFYNWLTLNEPGPVTNYRPESGITLSGHIDPLASRSITPASISLLAEPALTNTASRRLLRFTQTDQAGRFAFQQLAIYGEYEALVTAKAGDKPTPVVIDTLTVPEVAKRELAINWVKLTATLKPPLIARQDSLLHQQQQRLRLTGRTLQAVTVRGNRLPTGQRAFNSSPALRLDRSRVLSGGLVNLDPLFDRYIRYRLLKYAPSPSLKIFVNDAPLLSSVDLAEMTPAQIDHIDIHDGDADAYMYGANVVVAIYTTATTVVGLPSLAKRIRLYGYAP